MASRKAGASIIGDTARSGGNNAQRATPAKDVSSTARPKIDAIALTDGRRGRNRGCQSDSPARPTAPASVADATGISQLGPVGAISSRIAVKTAHPARKDTETANDMRVACHSDSSGIIRQRTKAPVRTPNPANCAVPIATMPARRAVPAPMPVPRTPCSTAS